MTFNSVNRSSSIYEIQNHSLKICKPKNSLKILYTNIDCLTKDKSLELEREIEQQNYDIIALTEIYPKNSYYDFDPEEKYKIKGYEAVFGGIEGRGTVIYVKKELIACKIEPTINSFKESVWVEMKLEGNDKLVIGCVYRSPNNDRENVNKLLDLMTYICSMRVSHILIVGDFNFRNIDWSISTTSNGENHIEYLFLEGVKDLFLHQHVVKPTRYRHSQVPSILDLIFTNEEDMIQEITYNPGLGKSDHLLLRFEYLCKVEHKNSQTVKFNYDKGDYQVINQKISNAAWPNLADVGVQMSWNFITECLSNLRELYIPKIVKAPEHKKSYIDRETAAAIKEKRTKWIKYKYSPTLNNYNKYKSARNNVTKCLRKSKYKQEQHIADNVKDDPKKFWKYIRGKSKTKSGINALEKNGKKLIDDKEIAEELNQHFISVFTIENDNIPEPALLDLPVLANISMTSEVVFKTMKEINPNKSQGPDDIHPKFILNCIGSLINPLRMLFEISLQNGKLPKQWKTANVSAIHKSGKKTDAANYRPISVTSIICRVMEKIIRNAIVQHLESNNLLSKYQHGFRKGRSCVTQLLECIEDWTEAIDRNYEVDIIYLDFKAAFDKVPHKRLLRKIWSIGIRGNVYKWLADFLSNRYQRVVVNGSKSSWEKVNSGVPQGSVLGPVLFLIYINDLPDAMDCILRLFADDTKLYSIIKNPSDEEKLQSNIFTACDWGKKWQMIFNTKKCKNMHIGRSEPSEYFMKDSESNINKIQLVQEEKDLGVIFDSKLKFDKHINTKVNIANRNLGLISRNFTYMNLDIFLKLYKALVRPHLEYASVIWAPRYKKDIITIENVQRRATKMIKSIKDLAYGNRLRKLGLPTLEYRRKRADMIQVFKIINNIDVVSVNLFEHRDGAATRGNVHKLLKPRPNSNIRKYSFSHRVVDTWNSLSNEVIEAPSVNAFKNRLNKFWHENNNLVNKFNAECYM